MKAKGKYQEGRITELERTNNALEKQKIRAERKQGSWKKAGTRGTSAADGNTESGSDTTRTKKRRDRDRDRTKLSVELQGEEEKVERQEAEQKLNGKILISPVTHLDQRVCS